MCFLCDARARVIGVQINESRDFSDLELGLFLGGYVSALFGVGYLSDESEAENACAAMTMMIANGECKRPTIPAF